MVNETTLLPIILAIIGASSGLLAWWQNRQNTRKMEQLGQNKVDSEAYERARLIFQASIDELEERISRLKLELADERVEKAELRARVEELERVVADLRKKLLIAGIPLGEVNE